MIAETTVLRRESLPGQTLYTIAGYAADGQIHPSDMEVSAVMTGEEVTRRYHIPGKVLKEYADWGLCNAVRMAMDDWQFDDKDLERLGLIMALHDMGFSAKEVENYVKLMLAGACTKVQRMQILSERRSKTLDEIHLRERQLERMDYLRNEIRNHEGGNENE